ncbi:MAG: TatD family hydrolase [Bdellovibrionaceae bacterium]|nr:TatD family hydrolase [Pseudobdellovibrionaceae bacterium]
MTTWIDMHAHLDKLDEGPEAALIQARAAGVRKIITIGTEPADHPIVLALSQKYYPEVFCTLGVHPHEGSLYTAEAGHFIEENLSLPTVVAVGEIGLDYYYEHSCREDQRKAFREQLLIAQKHSLPVEIHTRDAEADTIEILKEFEGSVTGLIHCFTGTRWLAEEALKLGYHISISGVVTFKNAEALREVVKIIPLERLHIETDAPFLSPVPQRGKKNTPAFVLHTAQKVSDIRGISMDELSQATLANAKSLFPKLVI